VLNAALCGAYYSEQRCGCAVPDLEWGVIGGGFLCCRVKSSVLVRCLSGADVLNFQEVRLLDAVVFKNWQWAVKCFVRWRIFSWILLSDCPCVGVGWMFTVYCGKVASMFDRYWVCCASAFCWPLLVLLFHSILVVNLGPVFGFLVNVVSFCVVHCTAFFSDV